MEAVFLEHTYRWLVMGGVLVLVIPFERLHDCAGLGPDVVGQDEGAALALLDAD